jgi:hypothetical protein
MTASLGCSGLGKREGGDTRAEGVPKRPRADAAPNALGRTAGTPGPKGLARATDHRVGLSALRPHCSSRLIRSSGERQPKHVLSPSLSGERADRHRSSRMCEASRSTEPGQGRESAAQRKSSSDCHRSTGEPGGPTEIGGPQALAHDGCPRIASNESALRFSELRQKVVEPIGHGDAVTCAQAFWLDIRRSNTADD